MSGTKDEAFSDIFNALMRLRAAFQRHNMEPPKAIELATIEDGARFRHSISKDMVMLQPMMGNNPARPDLVCNVCGIEVRFPARFRAREGGGFDIE